MSGDIKKDWPDTLRLWADDALCRGDDEARAAYAALADRVEELQRALERIVNKSEPHIDDTDEDRRRYLFHVNEIARNTQVKE